MPKTAFYSTLFFLFVLISTHAQTHIATYELTLIENENYDEYSAMAQEDAYTNNFYLIFDKNYSLFTSSNLMNGKVRMSDGYARTISEIIFDNNEKIFYFESFITEIQEKLCVKRKEIVNWQITDEKKNINNLECYRAIGIFESGKSKIRIDAWFAPSIPYAYGPSYFNGLPGLVVMATEGDEYFLSLSEINFNAELHKDSKTIPEKICTENVITYQEYTKILSETNN